MVVAEQAEHIAAAFEWTEQPPGHGDGSDRRRQPPRSRVSNRAFCRKAISLLTAAFAAAFCRRPDTSQTVTRGSSRTIGWQRDSRLPLLARGASLGPTFTLPLHLRVAVG